jgi:hypothetical protein
MKADQRVAAGVAPPCSATRLNPIGRLPDVITLMAHDVVEIVGDITDIEVIATGRGIRRLKHLLTCYGGRRWR